MSYLLDPHTLLWILFEPSKLSSVALSVLEDSHQEISVSAISFWEISLKHGLGKLNLPATSPEELPQATQSMGFTIAELDPTLLASYHHLLPQPDHKDPFDRLLIWQALQCHHCLISKDKKMKLYADQGLQTLW
ncbi:MAG: type II toxin-antitoxin system VapC family toxin [Verrucomicrobiales bacterium]|nr:type II toxin-antitoxin system VapC family toxin [Verrucomicrobiales bacterium]